MSAGEILSRTHRAGKGCGCLSEDLEEGRTGQGHLWTGESIRKEQMQRLEAGACPTCLGLGGGSSCPQGRKREGQG